jgi:hypothetical protein
MNADPRAKTTKKQLASTSAASVNPIPSKNPPTKSIIVLIAAKRDHQP